ncbi:aspartate aminotransferase [archaeon]|nr:aspartate aminotransferase [archaeon]|tara:strand:+ start:1494 stop:2618 length:1125 start_codon:yes stop_codon:yes gene_type:complete
MKISKRELNLPYSVLGELTKIASEDKKTISLSIGEPDFITPKPILKNINSLIRKATHYTPSSGKKELKEALVKKLKKENKINVNEDNIMVTCGSQEGIFASLLSVVDPKDEVIIPNPSYLGYIPAIELVSGVPVFFNLEEEDGFEVNPDNIKKLINRKTKAIILNTPSNPTGTVLSKKVLEEIADIVNDKGLYIFSDEAYEKIIYDKKHVSIGSLNGVDNVISFYTFSKTYAMCGFRLGYCVGSEKVIKAIDKSSHYVTICAPHISQLLGIRALKLGKKYIDDMVKEYRRRRDYVVRRLNDMSLRTLKPDGTFYAFSRINRKSLKFSKDLLKKKVAVVPGVEFGSNGEGYIRISYAAKMSLIKKGMDRIEKFVR